MQHPNPNFQNRALYQMDNLDMLRGVNSGTIDLIATDPPFNKGATSTLRRSRSRRARRSRTGGLGATTCTRSGLTGCRTAGRRPTC